MAHASPDQTTATWRHSAEAALRAAGLRCTFPRRAILDWIAAAAGPFTAEQMVAALETQHGSSSRATIYRLLDWLQVAGWLTRIYSDGTQHTYARLLPGHYHHAVCTACGLTLVFGGCDLTQALLHTLVAHGFTVQGHLLELYGQCANCQQA